MEHSQPHQQQQSQPPTPPSAVPALSRVYVVGGFEFECPQRYTVDRVMGRGAYGIVCAATDHVNRKMVAIKKINGVTTNLIDCKRTLREMLLLRHFKHEHIVTLKDVYLPMRDPQNFQEVYFVTDLMEFDLHQLITSSQPIGPDHIKYLTYQLLKGLKYIHSAGVLHRDLKPSNILLTRECELKICDFGLARDAPSSPNSHDRMTTYVATRWYRAPEILFCGRYSCAVDVWSVGCILAEIILRRPLFPGNTHHEQLLKVAQAIGPPPLDVVRSFGSEGALVFVMKHLAHLPVRDVRHLFPHVSEDLRDLLARMLEYDPRKRITVQESFQHPYLVALHDEADEPICETQIRIDLEREEMPALKQRIWMEAEMYRVRREQQDRDAGYVPNSERQAHT